MTRTLKIVVGIVLAIILIVIAGWQAFGPGELRLTGAQIQRTIDSKLPITKDDIVVDHAEVKLENDQMRVQLSMAGEKLGQKIALQAAAIGIPRYENGSFYFSPEEVEVIEFTVGNGESLQDKLKGAASRYLPGSEGAANLAEDVGTKVEEGLRALAEKGARFTLERIPMYRLPDDAKGMAAKVVLGDVYVDGDILVIEFSLWRLTWWVISALGMAAFVVIFVLAAFRSPGLIIVSAGSGFLGD